VRVIRASLREKRTQRQLRAFGLLSPGGRWGCWAGISGYNFTRVYLLPVASYKGNTYEVEGGGLDSRPLAGNAAGTGGESEHQKRSTSSKGGENPWQGKSSMNPQRSGCMRGVVFIRGSSAQKFQAGIARVRWDEVRGEGDPPRSAAGGESGLGRSKCPGNVRISKTQKTSY